MNWTFFKIFVRLLPCLLILVTACSRDDRSNPGYTYFDDMSQAVPYEYYSENPNFADGKTAQLPVKGAIPREFVPYPYGKTVEEQKRAGVELVNPIPDSPQTIARGKAMYEKYCMMCHGEHGMGDGALVTTKKITKEIPALIKDFTQKKSDGELFHVITLGSVSGFMGSYNWQLKPEDRWKIVKYIKTDLKKR